VTISVYYAEITMPRKLITHINDLNIHNLSQESLLSNRVPPLHVVSRDLSTLSLLTFECVIYSCKCASSSSVYYSFINNLHAIVTCVVAEMV